jgi:hypothetical protein
VASIEKRNNMKKLLYLLIILMFFSCEKKTKHTQKIVAKKNKDSKYENLLSKFKDISIDTLEVYSSENYDNYKGIKMDSVDAILFPKEIAEEYFLEHDLYACYKFDINSTKIGLLARTPSMYVPSSIKLFFYNKTEDNIKEYIELAESWGDAGDSMEKTSWIIQNKKNEINVLMRIRESHDHSIENENDTIVENWYYHNLINISKQKIDTISKDSKLITKKFKSLLNKASH